MTFHAEVLNLLSRRLPWLVNLSHRWPPRIADTGLIFGLSCVLVAMPVNRFILNRTGWIQLGSALLLVLLSVLAIGQFFFFDRKVHYR